ncbi:MAG: F-type H+-transporting ATPase subunit epsilon [Parcubacteria group bacterium Gr01-1014_13]|nr:MAG: F-type H+-transporting ATPase subunit epsilon [Parcubacteria group bacterium Gr01-1014_13]
MSTLKFKIVTPEKVIYENEILQVTIPTMSGEITILPNHIPLVSVLKAGEMRIKDKDGEQNLAVSGGFLEIRGNNEIVILADHAERAIDIDTAKAEEAKQRAEEQMKNLKNVQDVDYARLQAVIDRELNKIKIARKYKNLPNK